MPNRILTFPQVNRSVFHARTRDILNAVEDGHSILVATRNKPFAVILPLEEYEKLTGIKVKGCRWDPGLTPISYQEESDASIDNV
ncbi:MAG: hypothetical protein DRI61_13250 [Chloroflexi bacterium]|nr:MAG: hypothetical protein DRI61_13250 [Chloroflexota bacterium]